MSERFLYMFRFCCDPGFNDQAETAALLRYVDEALIDDVAVFANVEELNTGHMTLEEQDVYLAFMRDLAQALDQKGVTLSVNHWHSVMHADLGKTMGPHAFRPMVDRYGKKASLCVCPLCKDWQQHIARLYARYAQLHASILWVEDDFRLHNHDPLEWGGCFCEEHMRLYRERAGDPTLTREAFVEGVLKPGEPHPYRKIWLDVGRETMLSAARAIGEAVRAINPSVRVGLMSSVPHVHAAEGRDWHALLRALACGQKPVDRVHLPAYQELSPSVYLHRFNMVSMLTAAMLPPETDICPELENYPFSRFSKSLRFTRFQLLSALPMNLHGVMLDLYDLNGNGIVWEEGYQKMLRESKDYLLRLTGLGVFGARRKGVRVLYSPRSSYTLHTPLGRDMEELYPHECFFAGLLPALGIPYAYCDHADLCGEVVAVSGQAFRSFSPEEIRGLFAHNAVLINADAAWTLWDMGLGELAGIADVRWMVQNGGEYAYEQVSNGKCYVGREKARASAVISCSDAVDITYAASVHEYTALHDSFRRRTAAGQVVVDGRVLVFPFGRFASPLEIPPMLLTTLRREILQDMLGEVGFKGCMTAGGPYVEPYAFEHQGSQWLYLVNASLDDASEIVLSGAPSAEAAQVWLSTLEDSFRLQASREGNQTRLGFVLPAMEAALVRLITSSEEENA